MANVAEIGDWMPNADPEGTTVDKVSGDKFGYDTPGVGGGTTTPPPTGGQIWPRGSGRAGS